MSSKRNKHKYHLYEYNPIKYEVTNSKTLQQLLMFVFNTFRVSSK